LLLLVATEPGLFVEIEPFQLLVNRAQAKSNSALGRAFVLLRERIPELEPALRRAIIEAMGEDDVRTIDRENPRKTVGEVFRAHAGDPDAANAIAATLSTLVAHARACFARGDHALAYQWFAAIASAVCARARRFEDHDATLRDLATSAFTALCSALVTSAQHHSTTLSPERELALRTLFGAYRYDAEHSTHYARVVRSFWVKLTAADREFAARLATEYSEGVEAYSSRVFDGALLDIQGDLLADDDFVARCREAKRPRELLIRLLQRDKLEQAASEAKSLTESVVLEALEASEEFGCARAAERMVSMLDASLVRPRLVSWWRDRLLERADPEALRASVCLFLARPDRLLWRHVREQAKHSWTAVRSEILQALEQRGGPSWIEALIDESMIEAALEAAKTLSTASTHSVRVELAERAAKSAPIAAADLLRTQADALIAQRGRANYREAARILRRARELYEGAGQRGLWVAYGESLRARAREFPALKEELALSLARSSTSIGLKFDRPANDNAHQHGPHDSNIATDAPPANDAPAE
jgi:hypothetical protein